MDKSTARATTMFFLGFGLLLNLVEAIAHPDGWLWLTLRIVVGVLLAFAALAWLLAFMRARRANRRRTA